MVIEDSFLIAADSRGLRQDCSMDSCHPPHASRSPSLAGEKFHPKDLSAYPTAPIHSLSDGIHKTRWFRFQELLIGRILVAIEQECSWLTFVNRSDFRDGMGTVRTEQPFRASEQQVYGQVEALSHIVDALAKESSPDRLAEHVLRTTTEQLGAHSCSVWRRHETTGLIYFEFAFEGGKIIGKTASAFAGMSLELPIKNFWPFPELCPSGKPDLIEDIRLLPPFLLKDRLVALGIITVLMVPMAIAGRLEGAIGLRFAEKRAFRPEELELAQALASQAMLAMQLARLSAESRRAAVMEERNRMARDIHDTLAQGFTGVIVQLEAAKGAAASNDPPGLMARIAQASEVARAGLGEARRSVQALRPRCLNDGTLFMALDDLLKRMSVGTSLSAEFRIEGDPRPMPSDWEESLLRIAQESLTNTLKHARARNFRATLSFRLTGIQLQLVDDGRGFDVAKENDGYGLIGMKERVAQIGGQFAIHTKPDQGTEILVTKGMTDDAESNSSHEAS